MNYRCLSVSSQRRLLAVLAAATRWRRIQFFFSLGVALLMFVGPRGLRPAQAQIINVTSVLAVEAEEGLSGSFSGSLSWETGDDPEFEASLAPVFRYRVGKHIGILYGKGEYECDHGDFRKCKNSDGNEPYDTSGFGHARYRHILNSWLVPEGFTQIQYDSDEDLRLRALVGGGPFFQLFDRDGLRFGWGVAYMFEYEEYDTGDKYPQHRISSYLTGSYQMSKNAVLVETVYVQPLLTDPSDVRMFSDASLAIGIIASIAVNLTFSLSFDNCPLPYRGELACPDNPSEIDRMEGEFEKLDTKLSAAITYQF